jgi:hypothetical protein
MQKIKFYNSGLYNEPSFYKTYNTEDILVGDEENEYATYNRDLMKTRYSEGELKGLDEKQIKKLIEDDFHKDITARDALYSPYIFNEEIALDCGLIPFTYNIEDNINLLLLATGIQGYEYTPEARALIKLSAYQVLAHGTLDEKSILLQREYEDHCKTLLGNEVYNKVMKVINNEVIW